MLLRKVGWEDSHLDLLKALKLHLYWKPAWLLVWILSLINVINVNVMLCQTATNVCHPSCPPQSGYVRGFNHRCGCICVPISGWVANKGLQNMLDRVLIHDYCFSFLCNSLFFFLVFVPHYLQRAQQNSGVHILPDRPGRPPPSHCGWLILPLQHGWVLQQPGQDC